MPTYVKVLPEQIEANGVIIPRTQDGSWASICAANGIVEGDDPAAPFAISKIKVREMMESSGHKDDFAAFLASDPDLKTYWDDSVVLDSNHPKVVAAIAVLSAALGVLDMLGMLRATCKSEIV